LGFCDVQRRRGWTKKSAICLHHGVQVPNETYLNGTLHSALTNGRAWVFIIILLNPDSNGAKYQHSIPIAFCSDNPPHILKPWPDVLAGILFHWVMSAN
jgi:hypothetical protein